MNLKKCKGVGMPLYPKARLSKVTAMKDKGTTCKKFVCNMNKKYNFHLLSISEYLFLNIVKYSREIVLIILINLFLYIY